MTPSDGCSRCKHGVKRLHSALRLRIFSLSRTSICSRFFLALLAPTPGRQTARRDVSVSCPTIKRRSEEQIGEGKQAAIEEICEKSGSTRVVSEHWVAHRNRYNAAREAQRNHCRLQGKSYSARFGPFSSKRAVTYGPESPHHSGVITPTSTSLLLYPSVQR